MMIKGEFTKNKSLIPAKKCTCKETERHYCITSMGPKNHKHICIHCGGVMEKCRLPWD